MKYLYSTQIIVLAMVLGMDVLEATSNDVCPIGWMRFGDNCYLVVTDKLATGNTAEQECQERGVNNSHLASCLSTTEAKALQSYLKKTFVYGLDSFLIGINQLNLDGVMTNADGTAIEKDLPWRVDNPVEPSDDRCTVFGDGMELVNFNCYSTVHYICKSGPTSCAPKSVRCPRGWLPFENSRSCFLFVSNRLATGYTAERGCQETGVNGSHLASCLFKSEAYALQSFIKKAYTKDRTYFLVGINQINFFGVMTNADGTPIDLQLPWHVGNPLEPSQKKCTVFGDGVELVNYHCNLTAHYICKTGPTTCGPIREPCPGGWLPFEDSCFLFVINKLATGYTAEQACQQTGVNNSHLASCLSPSEAKGLEFYGLRNFIKSGAYFYVGINQINLDAVMTNADGTAIERDLPWRTDYPIEPSNDKCTVFGDGMELVNFNCNSTAHYICKSGPTMYSCFPKPVVCPNGWVEYENTRSCFLVVSDNLATGYNAEQECQKKGVNGSHLASCFYSYEIKALQSYLKKVFTTNGTYFFLGINQINLDGVMTFANGTSLLEPLPWHGDKPVEPSEKKCTVFGDGFELVNYHCNLSANYICKTGPTTCGPRREPCPEGWLPFEDSCFLFVSDRLATGYDADWACQKTGVNSSALASCLSTAEAKALQSYAKKSFTDGTFFYIGINQLNFYYVMKNADGTAIEKDLPWRVGSPVQSSDNKCTVFGTGMELVNFHCTLNAHYICKSGPTSCAPNRECPEGWMKWGQDTCYHFSDIKGNVYEAETYCASQPLSNSHLASCLTEDDGLWLQGRLIDRYGRNSVKYFFVGIHQRNTAGKFRYQDGSEIRNYLPWLRINGYPMIRQPSDKKCAVYGDKVQLMNFYCDSNAYYICKSGPKSCGPK